MNPADIKNPTAKGIFFAICAGWDTRQQLLTMFPKVSFHRAISFLISEKIVEEFQNGTFCSILEQNTADNQIKSKQSINLKAKIKNQNETETETELQTLLNIPDEPGKYIDSTDDIPALIGRLCKKQLETLENRRKKVRSFFYEKGISYDLIDRIALMPVTIGYCPDDEIYQEWKKLTTDYAEDTGLKCYVQLCTLIQRFYEGEGVEWKPCLKPSEYNYILTKKMMSKSREQRKQLATTDKQQTLFCVEEERIAAKTPPAEKFDPKKHILSFADTTKFLNGKMSRTFFEQHGYFLNGQACDAAVREFYGDKLGHQQFILR